MVNMLKHSSIVKKMEKEMNKNFQNWEDDVNWYTDQDLEDIYIFRFELHGKNYKLMVDKSNGKTKLHNWIKL